MKKPKTNATREQILARAADRRAYVAALRSEGKNLTQIGALLGVSRERARQLANGEQGRGRHEGRAA